MQNKEDILLISPIDDLNYDIDEIDHPMYMFSHLCSGSVMLKFNESVSKCGTVKINGVRTDNWTVSKIPIDRNPMLFVKLRGICCEYDSTAQLTVEDFTSVSGKKSGIQSFTVHIKPRRNSYPESYAAHDAVAFKAAAESIVLMKNDGILPLKENARLNLFGKGVSEYRSCSIGAGKINPRGCRGLLSAFFETSDFSLNEELTEFYKIPNNNLPDKSILNKAKEYSDIAIIVLTRGSGENIDNRPVRGEYYLSENEEELIKTVSCTFANTIVVLNVGYTIDVRFLKKYNISACIFSGYAGMFGAEALVSVLDGRSNPCGRLPDTWALDYYDIPSSANFLNFKADEEVLQTDAPYWSQICYEEGMYIGYRYFTSFGKETAYPFGYGLSYTEFENKVKSFSNDENTLSITVNVKNIGTVSGKNVIQIYVSKPEDVLEQCSAELVDFEKTKLLESGEETDVVIRFPLKRIASFDKNEWKLLKGDYNFYLGESAEKLCKIGVLNFKSDKVLSRSNYSLCCPVEFEELSRKGGKELPTGENSFYTEKRTFALKQNLTDINTVNTKPEKCRFADVVADTDKSYSFVASLSDYELCRLNVCRNEVWHMEDKGEAGRSQNIDEYGLPSFTLADGNNGVNIKKPNIGMPSSFMIAASFDKNLAYEVGAVIAEEARENNIDIILAPALNLHRNPLNGRGAEYFSEDPLLAGILAGYQNKGFQDNGVSGCIKHIAANNCEAVRKRSDSLIKERTLREIYLKAFEYAMEIEPSDTVMTGYNAFNGTFCDENQALLEGVLREDLGFGGFAMSDWNSYDSSDMVQMVKAGISFLTPGSDDDTRVTPLMEALNKGMLTRRELERNAVYFIKTMANRIAKRK